MARQIVPGIAVLGIVLVLEMGTAGVLFAQVETPAQKNGLPRFFRPPLSDFELGLGNLFKDTCTVSAGTQPVVYAGNSLVDCDSEVPHQETTIAVNPRNSNHIAAGYHSWRFSEALPPGDSQGIGNPLRIATAASVSFDGGVTWQESFPPATPYQFFSDPALAFNADGRLYFAYIAAHGPQGPAIGPSIVVSHSDDGGVTWSKVVTIARGQGGTPTPFFAPEIFQDKVFIGADSGAQSPFRNRVYVTWPALSQT